MISSERYKEIQDVAYSVILNHVKSNSLPINLLEVVNDIDNLNIKDYQSLMEAGKMSLSNIINLLRSKDGVLVHDPDSDEYRILFNKEINPSGRIRFTIAHELGHYFLGHEFENSVLCRFSSNSAKYSDKEKEANYFAKRLLAPLPVIKEFTNVAGYFDELINQSIFDVSNTASKYIMDNFSKVINHKFKTKKDLLIISKFQKYIIDCIRNPLCFEYVRRKSLETEFLDN